MLSFTSTPRVSQGAVESGGCREKVQLMGHQEKIVIYLVRDGKGRVKGKGEGASEVFLLSHPVEGRCSS